MNLKREHKLKHWGRLQYTLFLKGAVRIETVKFEIRAFDKMDRDWIMKTLKLSGKVISQKLWHMINL